MSVTVQKPMGYQPQYPYLEALMGYEPVGFTPPMPPPSFAPTPSIYPPFENAPPPTWGGEDTPTGETSTRPQYELVVTNPAVSLSQQRVNALPLPPPTNPELKQVDNCIFCRTIERINKLSGKVCTIAKGPLKLLGGTAMAAAALSFGGSTLIGAATTGTLCSIGSPVALLTGGATLAFAGCTYKCAKVTQRLFAAGFKDIKSLF